MKVVSIFRDKETGIYYVPGDVIIIKDEVRALDIESRGFAVRVSGSQRGVGMRVVEV